MPGLFDIIYYIIISIFIIIFAHYSFNYLKVSFTKETTKDVFRFQSQKYKEILEELQTISSIHKKDHKDHKDHLTTNLVKYSENEVFDFHTMENEVFNFHTMENEVFDFHTMENDLLEFTKLKLSEK
jgi:hypothetical protein